MEIRCNFAETPSSASDVFATFPIPPSMATKEVSLRVLKVAAVDVYLHVCRTAIAAEI